MAVNGLLGGDVPNWLGDWLLGQGVSYAPMSPQLGYNSQSSANWLQNWQSGLPTGMGQVNAATPATNTPVVLRGAKGLFDSLGGGNSSTPGPDPVLLGMMDIGNMASIAGKAADMFGAPFGVGIGINAIGQAVQANMINENVTIGEDLQANVNPVEAFFSVLNPFSSFGPQNAVSQLTAQDNMFGEPSFINEPLTMAQLAHMANPNVGLSVNGMLGSITGDAAAGVEAAQSVAGVAEAMGISLGDEGLFGGMSSKLSDPSDPDSGGGGSESGEGSGGHDSSGGCWVAGTQVIMGDNSSKNIEDLAIGDMVMTFPKDDQRWNTPLEPKAITELTVLPENIWWLNDTGVSKEEWVIRSNGEAARVKWLQLGDKLMTANGTVLVRRVEPKGTVEPVFNFMTADNYSYTADGIRTVRGMGVKGSNFAQPTPGKTMRECYKHVFKEELK